MVKKRNDDPGKGLRSQIEILQEALVEAQAKLAEETVVASAGGGAVTVEMSGTQECVSVAIDPKLLEDIDRSLVQDLILLAVNQAIHDSQVLAARKLQPLTGGLGPLGEVE